jgi:hypothetical protein
MLKYPTKRGESFCWVGKNTIPVSVEEIIKIYE